MATASLTLTLKQIEIADAALKLIGERGIAALSTSALAQELGVSSGAPFRHFSSREQILEAVAQRVADMVATTYPAATLPPLERLRGLFAARISTVGQRSGVARFIFSDQFAMALPPAAGERMLDLVRGTRAYVLAALEEAMARDELRTDLPALSLLPLVLGTLQHLVFLTALPKGLGSAPGAGEVLDTLTHILAPQPARKA
jgi:AcrR family transcriptional regulator